MVAGDWHELQTELKEIGEGVPWSIKPGDAKTWKDHNVDVNNNLAGAKLAQEILDKGGTWQEVEKAVVDAIQHHLGKDGRIAQTSYQLHTFLAPR
jgi:hypothetical protein